MNRVIIQDAGIHPAVFFFGAFICLSIVFFMIMRPSRDQVPPGQRFLANLIIVLIAVLPFIPIVTYYTFDHDKAAKNALSEKIGVTDLALDDRSSFKNLRCDFFTSNGTYKAHWVNSEGEPAKGNLIVQRYSDGSCSYEVK